MPRFLDTLTHVNEGDSLPATTQREAAVSGLLLSGGTRFTGVSAGKPASYVPSTSV